MGSKNWVLIALSAFLAFLIFLAPQLAWRLRAVLAPQIPDDSGSGSTSVSPERAERVEGLTTRNLALENAALKAELAKLENIKSQLPEKPYNYIRAIVLSRYPMNFKNEFLADAGATQGVEKGRAVVFGPSAPFDKAQGITLPAARVLIGRVEKVFEDTALVKTVFDGGFDVPVRIGPTTANALLKGGLVPQVALIPLDARVNPKDIVYSASPEYPYGLAVGEIKDIKTSEDKLFREATLEFAYDINEIRTVLIDTRRN